MEPSIPNDFWALSLPYHIAAPRPDSVKILNRHNFFFLFGQMINNCHVVGNKCFSVSNECIAPEPKNTSPTHSANRQIGNKMLIWTNNKLTERRKEKNGAKMWHKNSRRMCVEVKATAHEKEETKGRNSVYKHRGNEWKKALRITLQCTVLRFDGDGDGYGTASIVNGRDAKSSRYSPFFFWLLSLLVGVHAHCLRVFERAHMQPTECEENDRNYFACDATSTIYQAGSQFVLHCTEYTN